MVMTFKKTFGRAAGELLTISAAWLGQQRSSRRDEYQADAVSWELMVDETNAYNPQSLHSILTKLWSLEQDAGNKSRRDKDSESSTWDRDLLASVKAWSRMHWKINGISFPRKSDADCPEILYSA
jgi:hypothetical protein